MKLATTAIALTGLLPSIAGAQIYGDWDHAAAPSNIVTDELYVGPGSSSPNGTACDPFPTIGAAIAASSIGSGLVRPLTINVAPGVYTESFKLPMHGVALETWNTPGSSFAARATLIPDPSEQTAILVAEEGNPDLPGTVIRGLEFTSAPSKFAIQILPGPLSEDGGVEITLCEFRDVGACIYSYAEASEAVMRNLIHQNRFEWPFSAGLGPNAMILDGDGPHAPLIRSNEVCNFALPLIVSGPETKVAPSICSNLFQGYTLGVLLVDCETSMVNNTLAFSNDETDAVAIDTSGGKLGLYNNILWTPSYPPFTNIEYSGVGTTVSEGFNLFNTVPAGFSNPFAGQTPGFADVDGDFPMLPLTDCHDLHLASGSTMINAGDTTRVADLSDPVFPEIVSSLGSRVDVSSDFERDPRILEGNVDVGGDESTDTQAMGAPIAIALASTSAFQDSLGNLIPDASGTYTVTFDITGPAGAVLNLFYGFVFEETVPGTSIANSDIYHQSVTQNGTALFDLNGNYNASAGSVILNPAGTSISFSFSNITATNFEGELVFQGVMATPADLQFTNAITVELNEGCAP